MGKSVDHVEVFKDLNKPTKQGIVSQQKTDENTINGPGFPNGALPSHEKDIAPSMDNVIKTMK